MEREEVIVCLEKIATLMELKGENSFKIRAYNAAARALEGEAKTLTILIEEDLCEIKGIGKGLAEKIVEMHTFGKSSILEELAAEIPPELVQMLEISGLGAKKIQILHEQLNISTLKELQQACEQGKVADLPRFGNKVQANILVGLEALKKNAGLFLYSIAYEKAQNIIAHLKKNKDVKAIELAGSLRRKKEVTKDIDILVAADDSTSVMNDFVTMNQVHQVIGHGPTKSSVMFAGGMQADLRIVNSKQYPYALMYFTGSKEHNTEMRGLAKKQGYKLNEYGLFKGDELIVCGSESEVYEQLGLHFIVPELRENFGEIDCASQGELPQLVADKDLIGIFHMHTNYSDGSASVREIALAAKNQGYKYIGITDHSQSLTIANGMKPDAVRRQWEEINKVNEEFAPFMIFKGIESDILADGSLDYEEEILSQFDFIIASIHGNFKMSEQEMTERVIKAIRNPYTTMLGHPTGRLLLRREPYAINMHAVIDTAAEEGVIIEINAQPTRLDMDWRLGQYAKEKGILTCINPDAHTIEGLGLMEFGVGIARKGWYEVDRVVNAWSLEKVKEYLAERKKKAR